MAERIELTEHDLIEAILAAQAVQGGAAGAMTTLELASQTGMSRDTVRVRLRKLALEGRLEVLRVMRGTLDGRQQLIAAYRLRTEPKT